MEMENETTTTKHIGRDDVFYQPLPFKIPSREELHMKFGGQVYNSDFDRHTYLSDISDRIEADKKFDRFCESYNPHKKSKFNFNKQGEKNKW